MATRKRSKSLKDIFNQLDRIEKYYDANPNQRNAGRYLRASDKAWEYRKNIVNTKAYTRDQKAVEGAARREQSSQAIYGTYSPEYKRASDALSKASEKRINRQYVDYTTKAKAASNG